MVRLIRDLLLAGCGDPSQMFCPRREAAEWRGMHCKEQHIFIFALAPADALLGLGIDRLRPVATERAAELTHRAEAPPGSRRSLRCR
jgi:hypothetical protein